MSVKTSEDMASALHKNDCAPAKTRGGIIVLGEALIDEFPERSIVGGAPFNVACSAAALGADVCLITCLGDDDNGRLVVKEARRFGVSLAGVQTDSERPTGTVQVKVMAHENHYTIADDQAWDHLQLAPAVKACADISATYLYFGTLAQRSAESRATIQSLVKAFNGTVYLDLNLRDMPDIRSICENSLKLADIVKVNEEELRELFEWFDHHAAVAASWGTASFLDAVAAIVKKFALTGLLVTRGTRGYTYFDGDGKVNLEGQAVQNVVVADTVGAGDSFSAMFLASQTRSVALDQSLTWASELAAAICGIHGAVPTSREFYSRWRLPLVSSDEKNQRSS